MSFLNDSFGVRLGGLRRRPLPPPLGLGTPLNLSANAVSASQVDLTWSAVAGATHYNIYRDEDTPTLVQTRQLIATSATNSFSNTGLQGLTRYHYQVSAVDADEESALSLMASADTDAPANTIWVSPAGGGNGLSEGSPTTLATANSTVALGGMVVMLSGNYATQIRPSASPANSSQTITYKAAPGQAPVITGGTNAINLLDKSWVVIDGVEANGGAAAWASNSAPWTTIVMMNNTHHCTLKGCLLRYSNQVGIVVRGASTFNRIIYCYVDFCGHLDLAGNDVGECIAIRNGTFNLIEGCTGRHGGHNVLRVTSASSTEFPATPDFNVIRNNDLENMWDDVAGYSAGAGNRIGELMNCVGCVLDNNFMRNIGLPPDTNTPNGWKIEGDRHIVRRNVFFNTVAVGFSQTLRDPETPYSKNCRIYHNSLWGTGFGAAGGAAWDLDQQTAILSESANNTFKNNAVFDGDSPQIRLSFSSGGINNGCVVANNAFGPSAFVINIGGANRENGDFSNAVRGNLSSSSFNWAGGANPTTVAGFVPQAGSPLINAGEHLTTVTSATGSGTSVVVADAKYFCDGYDIEGLQGDEIQIGSGLPVRVTDVNYTTNTLTLAEARSWTQGDGVSQPWNGAAPDIGAVQT